ncbi:MAG TPA: alpha-hydroxy acid oxidase [Methylomirabilota bacterium]|nr:alpha-hydroxy acid oxidase [Methylomirabilota bacterium]
MDGHRRIADRRRFLTFLASSPLFALSASGAWSALVESAQAAESDGPTRALIASANDALNVFDFELVARQKLPPAHYGYLATGVDDDATLLANRTGFSKIQIRARRLVDVSRIDTSTELFGTTWKTPIVLAPVGSQKAFHADGEMASARAAGGRGHLQILSTGSTTSVENVTSAWRGPIWYQLYPTDTWRITQALVKRAERAGCPVLVLTVDLPFGRNTETEVRFRQSDTRQCASCHQPGWAGYFRRKPMFDGLDLTGVSMAAPGLTWEVVRRLRDITKLKLVLKGIETREDAELAVRHGVDGIIVSNHGGRAQEGGRGTIECLPEVVDGVQGKLPVLIDGGFRRGTDIFKALALGARGICIGRPYIWGLAAFGQAGVDKVLDILTRELVLMMRHAGTTSVGKIDRSFITTSAR